MVTLRVLYKGRDSGSILCSLLLSLCSFLFLFPLVMKILIFGAGGVGSVVGAFLARTGHEVSLLGRDWHLDEVEKKGLLVTGIWGDYRMKAFDCYRSEDEIIRRDTEFDLIILTVKSYDTAASAKTLKRLMKNKTMLLSLQNGLGNVESILDAGISAEQYLVGRLIFGVEIAPGVAKVTVNADDVRVGALPGVTTKLSAFQMAQILQTAKIPTQAVPDILTYVWAKVIYNCALNAICSIHEMPYGKILENEATRGQMEEVIRECYAVGHAKKIALLPQAADEFIRLMHGKLIPSTSAHHPSMLQDLRRGKQTDIDALNGAISRYGKELGLATPQNDALVEKIRSISQAARKI